MKYGCIGEHLSHSFSREIHNLLADYPYEIREVERDALDAFMTARDFLGINVTIPYKELVIPYLYYTDDAAKRIGAVNTIVNKSGKLYGYNTDFYGMSELISHAGVEIKDKNVAILGTGGTSKTARAVCEALGAERIITVSRRASETTIDYGQLRLRGGEIDVIINTSPVGMFPNVDSCPVELDIFPRLSGVIDAVYNPNRTRLISKARARGIKAEGGLYMLVAQAVRASEIFLDKKYPEGTLSAIYESVFKSKENIVLIGMPASGKSTVGRLLSERLGRKFVDTDDVIVEKYGMSIVDIFSKYGEAAFRDMETEAVREVSKNSSLVIATGGGAILRDENLTSLSQNGRLYFLDRPLEKLVPTASRPLANDVEAIKRRYEERYPRYLAAADEIINCAVSADEVAKIIGEKYK